jgi:hypothetical protein
VTRVLLSTLAATALAVGAMPAAAPAAAADGLRHCTVLSPRDVDRVGCWELVWVDGVEVRMTFANTQFHGNVPGANLGRFYVVGPQSDRPQSWDAAFIHDHTTTGATPRQNHGTYSVHLTGILVFCSEQGITSGQCVPNVSGLATTVGDELLTVAQTIEDAADAGLVVLFDTGAVIVGTVSGT